MQHDVFISFSSKDMEKALHVVNSLQSKHNIRCWICTQAIAGGTNYKDKIIEAISASEVVVFLQSKDSLASPDVSAEISLAFKRRKIIIPFILEHSDITGSFEYNLTDTHAVDGIRPEFSDRIDELAASVLRNLSRETLKPDVNDRESFSLCSNMPLPCKHFIGRNAALARIAEHLNAPSGKLFICGMGGIGKSQLVKKYAQLYAADFDVQIFANYSGSLVETIASDTNVPINGMEIGSSPAAIYFSYRKMPELMRLVNDRTLLVIDNFDVEDDDCLEDLLRLPCKILITTRTDFSDRMDTLILGSLEDRNELRNIFTQNYAPRILPPSMLPDVDELIDYLDGHTMAIGVIAKQCASSRITPKNMLKRLKEISLHSLGLRERISYDLNKPQTGYDLFCALFSMESLTEEEAAVLYDLAIVPNKGISTEIFHDWCELDSYEVINSLVQRNWILLDPENDVISLHPLISEVVRGELVKGFPFDSRLMHTVLGRYQNNGWADPMNLIELRSELILHLLEKYPEVTDQNEDLIFSGLLKLTLAAGTRQLIIDYYRKIEECRSRKYDKFHLRNLEICFAQIQYRMPSTPEEDMAFDRKLWDIINYLKEKKYFKLAMQFCINRWSCWNSTHAESSFAFAEEAIRIFPHLTEDEQDNLREVRGIYGYTAEYLEGSFRHAMTGYYLALGEVEKAYQSEKRAEEILSDKAIYLRNGIEDVENHMEMNLQSILSSLGSVYIAMGDWERAQTNFEEKELILLKHRDSKNEYFRRTYIEMLRIYKHFGNVQKLDEYKSKLLRLLEANYAPDDPVFKNAVKMYELNAV